MHIVRFLPGSENFLLGSFCLSHLVADSLIVKRNRFFVLHLSWLWHIMTFCWVSEQYHSSIGPMDFGGTRLPFAWR
jgi:hypothetical protein